MTASGQRALSRPFSTSPGELKRGKQHKPGDKHHEQCLNEEKAGNENSSKKKAENYGEPERTPRLLIDAGVDFAHLLFHIVHGRLELCERLGHGRGEGLLGALRRLVRCGRCH